MSRGRKPQIYILRVSLLGVAPEIWRVLAVPASITLGKLHRVLQTVLGWGDYHLHQFETSEGAFGIPDPDFPDDMLDERRIRLSRFLKSPRDRIRYEYDFGDGWRHDIRLERVLDPIAEDVPIVCLGGARACPPEDVGGPPGYAEFLEAIRDRGHPEHDDLIQWIGGHFDAEAFDEAAVNRALARF